MRRAFGGRIAEIHNVSSQIDWPLHGRCRCRCPAHGCPRSLQAHPCLPSCPPERQNGLRRLKEQIVHGRIYQSIDDMRHAVRTFVARYNAEWLIEKNGLRSPNDARTAWDRAAMKAAA